MSDWIGGRKFRNWMLAGVLLAIGGGVRGAFDRSELGRSANGPEHGDSYQSRGHRICEEPL